MNAEKIKEIRLGQVRWPNEIMWSDEQRAKQGWLAIVPNHELQALLDEVEALKTKMTELVDAASDVRPYCADIEGVRQIARLRAAIDAARHEPKDAE